MQIALRATALCAALLAILGTRSVAGNWLSDESGLPICRPSCEDRVPIPIWLGSISNTSDRDTPAPPPRRWSISVIKKLLTALSLFACRGGLMPTKLLATNVAVVFLLIHPASAGESPAPGDDWATPSLPACRAVNETRTAMPVWKPGVTRDAKISSAPPQGVMYVDLFASFDVQGCNGLDDDDFVLTAPSVKSNARLRGTKVSFDEGVDVVRRDCIARGFYLNTPTATARDGWRKAHLHQLNKFEILTSGRFCRANAASASHPPRVATLGSTSVVAPHAGEVLPTCRNSDEWRMEVPVWEPQLTPDDEIPSQPPQGDGKLVYMSIVRDTDCPGVWQDQFYTLERRNPDNEQGGVSVALRGNVRSEGGHCIWSGLFMNDAVSYQMGWASAVFIAVDEARAASSDQYCLARKHGHLHRATQPK